MDQCFVGVHYLLQVEGFVAVVGEGGITIEVLIGLDDVLYGSWRLDNGCAEDASGEVATIGDEVDVGIEITLYLLQRLADLCDVLVLEGLVDAQVVITPREVRRGAWLLSCSSRARDGIDSYIVLEQIQIGCRQQGYLYAGGKTAGIGHVLGL